MPTQLDERAVRVLAHPLRSRILSRLRLHGPATATDLASAFATNTGATSYHLRALESVGLVNDTGRGTGRRRIWQASTPAHAWTASALPRDDDTRAALDWLQRGYVRDYAERAERWLDAADNWPAEWVDLLGTADAMLTVTPDQFATFRAELQALIARHSETGVGDPHARRILISMLSNPVELRPPGDD